MAALDVKREVIRILKEDEEFRYAVAGLLGISGILDELRKLREDFLLFVKEQEKRWEENAKKWEKADERFAAIESELKRLREDFLLFVKEQEKRWEENNKRWEENAKKWEEDSRRWEESNKRFSRIEIELGSLSESLYCRYAYEDLEKELAAAGERILSRVRSADFDGVEVDLAVTTERAVYVVEVKVKPSTEDVDTLLSKADVVRQKTGKEVVPVLTGALIGRDVESYAKGKGVRVYRY